MRKNFYVLPFLLLIFILALLSCTSNKYNPDYVYDGESLVGKWQESSLDEKFYKMYEFTSDGKAKYAFYIYGMECEYYTILTEYRIEGNNKIIMSNDEGAYSENYFSINDEGELIISDGKNDIASLVSYNLEYNESPEIYGKWECTGDGIEWQMIFNEDYSGENILSGQKIKIKYSTKANTLYMLADEYFADFTADEAMITQYEIKNDILTLIVSDGTKHIFERI